LNVPQAKSVPPMADDASTRRSSPSRAKLAAIGKWPIWSYGKQLVNDWEFADLRPRLGGFRAQRRGAYRNFRAF
jgi:hypothetical protein